MNAANKPRPSHEAGLGFIALSCLVLYRRFRHAHNPNS
jgi:hypothetical protein